MRVSLLTNITSDAAFTHHFCSIRAPEISVYAFRKLLIFRPKSIFIEFSGIGNWEMFVSKVLCLATAVFSSEVQDDQLSARVG